MAPEWEAAMGMELGMGTTSHAHYHNAPPAAATSTMAAAAAPFVSHFHFSTTAGDPMRVDELLDLSSHLGAHNFFPGAAAGAMHGEPTPPPSAAAAAASSSDHHTSSFNLSFADEFYIPVPTEEAAELEWLSNFVDDSYPDVPNYPPAVQAAMAAAARNGAAGQQLENSVSAAPGRGARSKRSRAASAAAAAWHALVPRQPSPSSSSSSSDLSSSKPARSGSGGGKKSELGGENNTVTEAGVRRCTHCASEKTPQWRTGPLGPKTLCNACGVRYKSGRLVPEYRPAASPTFVLTQHSNSHRKVMELRRQNELLHLRGSEASGTSGGGGGGEQHMFRDYGVC